MRGNKPYKVLLQNYMRITGITIWEQWRYRFDFERGIYAMYGEALYIRPAEELYLYERLVLYKPPKETVYRYAIQRLRERHGADFLAEVLSAVSPAAGVMSLNSFYRSTWRKTAERSTKNVATASIF
jgi:hypothetical protein